MAHIVAQLVDEGAPHKGFVGVGIVQYPVRIGRQAQKRNPLVHIVFAPCFNLVGFLG